MEYQEFITLVEKSLSVSGTLPPFQLHKVTKNNGVIYDGLVVMEAKRNVSPMIYLPPYYEQYKKGDSIEKICMDISETYERNLPKRDFDADLFCDYEKAKERIVYRLVNYERNKKLLEEIPHVKYLDFAIIFYYLVNTSTQSQANILIHNHHLSYWKIDTDALLALAKENTSKLLPVQMEDLASVVLSMIGYTSLPLADLEYPMYILTNKYKTNGATVLLYDGLLAELSHYFKSDLLIIPSSIHEILVLPADHPADPEAFRSMIAQVNDTELTAEEVLSDNAYLYSSTAQELSILS